MFDRCPTLALSSESSLSIHIGCWLGCSCSGAHAMPQGNMLLARVTQLIFYPTAIGTEPQDDKLDSYLHWARVMMGHAGANLVSFVSLKLELHTCSCPANGPCTAKPIQLCPQRSLPMLAWLLHGR